MRPLYSSGGVPGSCANLLNSHKLAALVRDRIFDGFHQKFVTYRLNQLPLEQQIYPYHLMIILKINETPLLHRPAKKLYNIAD